jgi:NADPH:quinone reductase-like Zn-dependent oxidoreductase
MPSQMLQGARDARLVEDFPISHLRSDYVLIRTSAVALNPTDWKHIDKRPTKDALVGCDYAGIVEEVGKDV